MCVSVSNTQKDHNDIICAYFVSKLAHSRRLDQRTKSGDRAFLDHFQSPDLVCTRFFKTSSPHTRPLQSNDPLENNFEWCLRKCFAHIPTRTVEEPERKDFANQCVEQNANAITSSEHKHPKKSTKMQRDIKKVRSGAILMIGWLNRYEQCGRTKEQRRSQVRAAQRARRSCWCRAPDLECQLWRSWIWTRASGIY